MAADTLVLHEHAVYTLNNMKDTYGRHVGKLVEAGKAYFKAVEQMCVASQGYVEALTHFADSARNARGSISEIGDGVVDLANAYKEGEAMLRRNANIMLLDFIVGVESRLVTSKQQIMGEHKAYTTKHRALATHFDKVREQLTKFQKKGKKKEGADKLEKMQCEVADARNQLESCRRKGLSRALLIQKNNYSYVASGLAKQASLQTEWHRGLYDSLSAIVPAMESQCRDADQFQENDLALFHGHFPLMQGNDFSSYQESTYRKRSRDQNLPNMSSLSIDEGIVKSFPDDAIDQDYDGDDVAPDADHIQDDYMDAHDGVVLGTAMRGVSDYGGSESLSGPNSSGSGAYGGAISQRHLIANFSHAGSGASQLSFVEGDLVLLESEWTEKGWCFGQNIRTSRNGWFPASFFSRMRQNAGTKDRDSDIRPGRGNRFHSLENLVDSHSKSNSGESDFNETATHSTGTWKTSREQRWSTDEGHNAPRVDGTSFTRRHVPVHMVSSYSARDADEKLVSHQYGSRPPPEYRKHYPEYR